MTSGPEIARGHVLAAGRGGGAAFVTDPVSFWGGVSADEGRIIDVHHRDRGRSVAGTVLVMRVGRGSSSASAVLAETLRLGVGPAAIVLAAADVILAAGSVVARELYGIECPIVELDPASFDAVAARAGTHLDVDATYGTAVVSALNGPWDEGGPETSASRTSSQPPRDGARSGDPRRTPR